VTIDAVGDSVFGDVLDPGNAAILATTCVAGTAVLPGAGNAYSCTFDANVTGNASGPAHSDTVTVDASDDEGNTVQGADDASVAFNDVVPTLTVTKTPTPGAIDEPGATVSFGITVTNDSTFEAVDLTSLAEPPR
jgi:hypothetical protein